MKTTITKTVKTDRRIVKLTSLVVVEGRIRKPGTFVQMSLLDAADLIGRKRAVPATEAEVAAAGDAIVLAPVFKAEKVWVDA